MYIGSPENFYKTKGIRGDHLPLPKEMYGMPFTPNLRPKINRPYKKRGARLRYLALPNHLDLKGTVDSPKDRPPLIPPNRRLLEAHILAS